MAKNLIVCPICEEKGNKKSLAVVLPGGVISIRRQRKFDRLSGYSNQSNDHTMISGKEFELYCGDCGEMVYYKSPETNEGTIWDIGVSRVNWVKAQGTYSGTILGTQVIGSL